MRKARGVTINREENRECDATAKDEDEHHHPKITKEEVAILDMSPRSDWGHTNPE
jgi:hypothetical protein